MSRFMHMSLDVAGALRWPDEMLREIITDKSGAPASPDAAREWLRAKQAEGCTVLPMGACDNHDPKKGCLGHPEDEP